MSSSATAVKDMEGQTRLLDKPRESFCVRAFKCAALLVVLAAVVFGSSYAAFCLYNRNHPAPAAPAQAAAPTPASSAAPTTTTLNDVPSTSFAMADRIFAQKYAAAKQERIMPGTPRIAFYDAARGHSFDATLPLVNTSATASATATAAAPVLGWAKLVHKDDVYGPIRPESTAVEFEERIEEVVDAAVLAELMTLVPDGADLHTAGFQPTPPSDRRQLFFTPPTNQIPGVIGSTDRRSEITCAQTDTDARFQSVVDLLSVVHCSGTLVGNNIVLTAGHCLHTGGAGGQWMLPQSVTPRACQGRGALGAAGWTAFPVASAWVHQGWMQGGQANGWGNDVGVLLLNPVGGRSAGAINGFLSMQTDGRQQISGVQVHGYPGQAGTPPANQFHNLW